MFKLRLLILLAFFAVSTTTSAATRYALVVGVNGCPNFRVGGIMAVRPLRGAQYDAGQFAETLKKHWSFTDENLTLLLGNQATYSAVSKAMAKIVAEATSEDSVVFYYAGHGTQTVDQAPLDEPLGERLDEALCLFDANERGENLLIDDQIARWINHLRATQVSVILDCCHSGTGVKGNDDQPVERGITLPVVAAQPKPMGVSEQWNELGRTRKASGTRLIAFYACDSGQSAYERRFAQPAGQPMGQFTRHLLEVLTDPTMADADEDGSLSVSEAAGYVRSKLDEDFNHSRPASRRQTPHFDAARSTWSLLPR